MSYSASKWMLAAIIITTAFASEIFGQSGEAPKDKGKKAEPTIRLTLEAPLNPIILDIALSGAIPIRLWAENLSDKPVIVCHPVDGSYLVQRDPAYVFRLVDAKGGEL
jgi:hypothetical protein